MFTPNISAFMAALPPVRGLHEAISAKTQVKRQFMGRFKALT